MNKILNLERNIPAPKLLLSTLINDKERISYLQKRAAYNYELAKKIYEKKKDSVHYPANYLYEMIFILGKNVAMEQGSGEAEEQGSRGAEE